MLEGWEWISISVSFESIVSQSRGRSRGDKAVTYFLLRSCVAIHDFFSGVLPGWIAKLEYFSWLAGRCFFFFVRVIVYCVDRILPCDYFACRRFLVLNLAD